MNQKLSSEEDCGSKDFLDITIENEDILSRLIGRYRLNNKKLKLITEEDTKLIGRAIKLRSPMTCKCHDGICKTCNGDSWKINPFHIGISGVLTLTEQLTQVLLSSKHLLQVNPEKVILPVGFEKFFYVDKTSLVSKKQFKINIQKIETNDEDEFVTSKVVIIDGDENHTFEFPEGQELCLTPISDKVNIYKPDNIVEIFEDVEVFNLIIENSELVTPLKNLIKLLESEATLNESSISELLQTFLSLLSRAKLSSSSLAIELVLRELMRDPIDIQERPIKFDERIDYKFLKLTNALVNSPSLGITLSFERLNYVVENNIFKKSSGSLIDGLF